MARNQTNTCVTTPAHIILVSTSSHSHCQHSCTKPTIETLHYLCIITGTILEIGTIIIETIETILLITIIIIIEIQYNR